MTTTDEVRAELTDILVSVVGCDPDDVEEWTRLKSLGVDSLAVVEVADELGRRFAVHLADDTVNGLVTVHDAVSAVAFHDGSAGSGTTGPWVEQGASRVPLAQDPQRRRALRRVAGWFVVVGATVGIVLGLGGAALVGATFGSARLPPLVQPTSPAPVTATPTPTATPEPDPDATADPDPTLVIGDTQVSPGQRFTLQGTFPGLDRGDVLQVQVKDPDVPWDDFPVTTKVRDDGSFRTEIYTSRTGRREFRVVQQDGDLKTPSVPVQIG